MRASITGGIVRIARVNSKVMEDQFGHAVYIRLNAMLFNTMEIVQAFYKT